MIQKYIQGREQNYVRKKCVLAFDFLNEGYCQVLLRNVLQGFSSPSQLQNLVEGVMSWYFNGHR